LGGAAGGAAGAAGGASGTGGSGQPGEGDQQRDGLVETVGEDGAGQDTETAVAGQEVRPGRRGRVEHGVLGDPEVKKRHEKGNQDSGDLAE